MATDQRDTERADWPVRDLYYSMKLIREFENKRQDLVDSGEIIRHAHLYQGQEAVAAGVCQPLNDEDLIASTHRCTGHVLAKGCDPNTVMAEFGGKTNGIVGGRGGEMHLYGRAQGLLETTAMVGGSAPHLAGAMLSAKLDGLDTVGVSFFGDGAINQGVVHETMNLAAVWDLPVLFVCEDNKYAVTSPAETFAAGDKIVDRAQGYGIEGVKVDGQDVFEVYAQAREMIEEIRSDSRPRFIECDTYRFTGHHSSEDKMIKGIPYRSDAEVDEWKTNRDPLELFKDEVLADDTMTAREIQAVDDEVADVMTAAMKSLTDGDLPDPERATEHVYANQEYENFPAGRYD